MGSPHVKRILERIKEIHDRKNHDYAQEDNPFSNFERSGELISWFADPVHQSFAGLIGIKLARLAELLNGKEAKNESIDDSFLDLCTYCVLFHSYYLEHIIIPPTNVRQGLREISQDQHLFSGGVCTKCGKPATSETVNWPCDDKKDQRLP